MKNFRNSRVLHVVSRAIFFFCMGVFALEAFLDINPTNVTVVNTNTSVSFYVYITFYNMLRYFPIGFGLLAIGAILFAFSKYRLIPLVLAGFVAAFYYEVVLSTPLLNFYESTYACHYVSSGSLSNYVCPLVSMIQGNPNIPLQGDVTGFIAFVAATVAFALSRIRNSVKMALLDMFGMASCVLCIFEVLIYFYESEWYTSPVTYYQAKIYLGNLTNQDLLAISVVVLATTSLVRIWLQRRSKRKRFILEPPHSELT